MSRIIARRRRARAELGSLGSVQSTLPLSGGRAMGSVQSSYAFAGLGDEAPAAEMTELEWRARMLAAQTTNTEWTARWVKRDEMQRWIQIAATLSIPLAAAVWRAIFGRRGDI